MVVKVNIARFCFAISNLITSQLQSSKKTKCLENKNCIKHDNDLEKDAIAT